MMRWIMLLIIFFLFGAFFIISNNNLHLSNQQEFSKFGGMYYSWLDSLFGNLKSMTGYVVKFDWLPKETINGTVAK